MPRKSISAIVPLAILVVLFSSASRNGWSKGTEKNQDSGFIKFHTKNLNKDAYRQIIQKYLLGQFGPKALKKIEREWEFHIQPIAAGAKHINMTSTVEGKVNSAMPWGYMHPPAMTSNKLGKGQLIAFLADQTGVHAARMNADPLLHEVCHVGVFLKYGDKFVERQYDDPQMKAGTGGPAYAVLVHDVYYGSKKKYRFNIDYDATTVPIAGIDLNGVVIKPMKRKPAGDSKERD